MAGHGFLIVLAGLLLWKKKYAAVLVGLAAGVLYMIVDYGIFHLVCGARSMARAQPFSRASLDEHELRLYQFCMDLAVAL